MSSTTSPAKPSVPNADRLTALREAQAAATRVLIDAIPEGHKCGPITVVQSKWDDLTEAHSAEDAALAALIPTEQDAIRLIADCHNRLKQLGWGEAIYCPKDGSEFDVIEFGSTGIHKCHYSGEWPDGHWWIADDGDLWPSRPIMYRISEGEKARWKAGAKRLREAIASGEFAAQGTEARRAETLQDGSVHDGPVAESDAPIPPHHSSGL